MHIPPCAAPYSRQSKIGRSELYMGCPFTWLATAEDTAGQFALVEPLVPQGVEPAGQEQAFQAISFTGPLHPHQSCDSSGQSSPPAGLAYGSR
jgi:hypothetical protein